MDQKLEQGHTIRKAAVDEAIDWLLMAEARGVPTLTTATAAAMLIGQIFGSNANDEAHLQFGLDQMMNIARVTGKDWLGVRVAARH
jgi:hypothetical protein